MRHKRLVLGLLALPLLGACESYFASKPEITGGVLCNVLGHQVVDDSGPAAATSESVRLGRFLGRRIGREVYLIDELKTAEALESSCDGHATTWRNTDTGQRYSVTPTQTHLLQSGRCRDFTTVAEDQGREQVIHGKACRQPDGTWKAPEV
jgi:surface antigen